ncbi:MAG: xanthine dehydrogenase family protein molybdopterin-binding subunit [Vulcanimicrobiota bacterium]
MIASEVKRIDGPLKVTGEACYAGEFADARLLYGVIVSAAISKGRLRSLDTRAAEAQTGVVKVFTHQNVDSPQVSDEEFRDMVAPPGSPYRPLGDDRIRFPYQPIALVVAESFEAARAAARLVEADYATEPHEVDLRSHLERSRPPQKGKLGYAEPPDPRGQPDKAFEHAAVQLEATYFQPAEHHNPMEPHATTVVWEEDGHLTVYDKTQGIVNTSSFLKRVFGLGADRLTLRSPYVGGAFGSALRPQAQLYLAVLAALNLERSIRVVLTRQQMFSFGHRPQVWQRVALGADREGKLEALIHEAITETSRFEEYAETVVDWAATLYECPNVRLSYQSVPLDLYTPLDMRAPGGVTGLFALECALDELSYKLSLDPLELRLRNYSHQDPATGKPFSSKELKQCYMLGAEAFGWSKRPPQPRSLAQGHELVGYGMATGIWEVMQMECSARAVLDPSGRLTVSAATSDIGTGTYTIMTQIAAEFTGLPLDRITFILGDSRLPSAPLEGGSMTAASVGSAVKAVCDKLMQELASRAGMSVEQTRQEVWARDLQQLLDGSQLEVTATSQPPGKAEDFSTYTHGAAFAEVRVDRELGTVRVARVVNAAAAGRVLNPKTARSQVLGGVVWGLGMALLEHSQLDPLAGRFVNHNLAEYHLPCHADMPDVEIILVHEDDPHINPLGVKGLGEIGGIAVCPAIANAVFHATGIRVRQLPITLDKLL